MTFFNQKMIFKLLLKILDVESDSKIMVDAVNGFSSNLSEFGVIVGSCKKMLNQCMDVNVSFIKQQANRVAHALANAARFHACQYDWQEVPAFLESLVFEEQL